MFRWLQFAGCPSSVSIPDVHVHLRLTSDINGLNISVSGLLCCRGNVFSSIEPLSKVESTYALSKYERKFTVNQFRGSGGNFDCMQFYFLNNFG